MNSGRLAAVQEQLEAELRGWASRHAIGAPPVDCAAQVAEQARRMGLPVTRARLVGDVVQLDYVEPIGEG